MNNCNYNNCKSNYKTVKYYFSNSNLCPEIPNPVFEPFSLYGSLRGGSRNLTKSDQCYCHQKSNGEMLKRGGQCYPVKLCGDCELEKTGSCSQSAEPSGVAGI